MCFEHHDRQCNRCCYRRASHSIPCRQAAFWDLHLSVPTSGGSLKLLGTTDASVLPSGVITAKLNSGRPNQQNETGRRSVLSIQAETTLAIPLPTWTMVASAQGLEPSCATTCCSSQAQHTALRWYSCPTSASQLLLLTTNAA